MLGYTQVSDFFTFRFLKAQSDLLYAYVHNAYVLSVLLYMVLYICIVLFSLPAAAPLTILGGFLFGFLRATFFVVGAATVGSLGAFWAIRYLFAGWYEHRYTKQLTAMQAMLARNGASYLLVLRLLPIFPFFLVNIGAALMPISWTTFFWTTACGIVPGTMMYAYAGRAIHAIDEVGDVYSLPIIVLLGVLAMLSFLPVFVRWYRTKK